MDNQNQKTGVMDFGYVKNLWTYINDLNLLTSAHSEKIEESAFNHAFDSARKNNEIDYLNKFGRKVFANQAHYAIYGTGLHTEQKEEIFSYFERNNTDNVWCGVFFATHDELNNKIDERNLFRMGKFYFDDPVASFQKAYSFLEKMAERAIPEKWTFKNYQSPIPHPILKSYLENTFVKVKYDRAERLLVSDDGEFAVFNSGLLDKFFHPIFIILKRNDGASGEKFYNPCIAESIRDYQRLGIKVDGKNICKIEQLPSAVEFFSNISEVVFNPGYMIDRNFNKFEHIVTERIDRFPDEYQKQSTEQRARALDGAIDYAVALAERNYKLVVPQYRPAANKLQLLMPIYLKGTFDGQPDIALVLDLENEFYIPETILKLDMAYQNARLIAKPDSFWLNPDEDDKSERP